MTTMIERVARAILPVKLSLAWDTYDPETRHEYMEKARAAIAAMREPTMPMLENGTTNKMVDGVKILKIWRAMIDAALEEK